MAEGARLESGCALNGVPRVRIPLSPPSLVITVPSRRIPCKPRQARKGATVANSFGRRSVAVMTIIIFQSRIGIVDAKTTPSFGTKMATSAICHVVGQDPAVRALTNALNSQLFASCLFIYRYSRRRQNYYSSNFS